jgi:hypothetical protein
MIPMSKKKAKRAAVQIKELPPEVQAASTFEDLKEASAEQIAAVAKPVLAVGSTYAGTDGKTYEVIALNGASVVAKHDKKKIPFPRDMFEVLVGIKSEDTYKQEQEERRLERKQKAEASTPKEQRVSTMSVIRNTLANNLNATLVQVIEACRAAGVPAKSESTVKTIMSDFKQTYTALFDAGRIVID